MTFLVYDVNEKNANETHDRDICNLHKKRSDKTSSLCQYQIQKYILWKLHA